MVERYRLESRSAAAGLGARRARERRGRRDHRAASTPAADPAPAQGAAPAGAERTGLRRTRHGQCAQPRLPARHGGQHGVQAVGAATASGPGVRPCMPSRIGSSPRTSRCWPTQLFIEMLKSGYTCRRRISLHPSPARRRDLRARQRAVGRGHARRGRRPASRLTFLPTLYQTSDFGAAAAQAPSRCASLLDTDQFLRAVEARRRRAPCARCRSAHRRRISQSARGAAARARARRPRACARSIPPTADAHPRCRAGERGGGLHPHTGRRPIELLLEQGDSSIGTGVWCMPRIPRAAELEGIADYGRFGLRVDHTEANLGRWIFRCGPIPEARRTPMRRLRQPGHGDPAEELRWMEYQQRLRKGVAPCSPTDRDAHVGTRLWRDAARYGAQARRPDRGSHRGRPPRGLAGARRRPSEHGRRARQSRRSTTCCSPARRARDPRRHGGRTLGGQERPAPGRRASARALSRPDGPLGVGAVAPRRPYGHESRPRGSRSAPVDCTCIYKLI